MLALAAKLGFASSEDVDPHLVRVDRSLAPPRRAARFVQRLRRLVTPRPVAFAAPVKG
jgi:hypothetical protein